MATYSDFVLDEYKRPILGAKVEAYASDGTTLLDATVTDALGAFTVTADDQVAILLVDYGGCSERSSIIIGVPPEFVGPPGPALGENYDGGYYGITESGDIINGGYYGIA